MEHSNNLERYYRENTFLGAMQGAIDVMKAQGPGARKPARSSSRPNLKTNNFSYPRADGHPPRHESADSRSSVTSNGSMPGMTDASDSEVSIDDDYHYNTSASQLWDSFWPSGSDKKQSTQKPPQPPALRSSPSQDYLTIKYSSRRREESEDDTITLSQFGREPQEAKSTIWPFAPPATPPRPQANRKSTYSIYPKPSTGPTREAPLPPRMSFLAADESAFPRRKTLKASKSLATLKTSQSRTILLAPPTPAVPTTTTTRYNTNSAHISPVGPPPILRPSASAYNIREQRQYTKTHHNATPALSPLAQPSALPADLARPQAERFVSVFELDSDNESDAENGGFAKRIARGLHKKSNSAQRENSAQRASGLHGEDGMSRRRGGSLGRILGLKGR